MVAFHSETLAATRRSIVVATAGRAVDGYAAPYFTEAWLGSAPDRAGTAKRVAEMERIYEAIRALFARHGIGEARAESGR